MPLHVLILPTEEFLPAHEPLAGIFQGHQLEALRMTGNEKFGVLSIRLRHSVPMYIRSILRRLALRPADPALPGTRLSTLCRELTRRWFEPRSTVTVAEWQGTPVLRVEGLYGTPPSRRYDPIWWQRTGWAGYREYCARYGRPDLIHAHNTISAGLLAHRISRREGIPYVLTEHSSAYQLDEVPASLFPAVRAAIAGAKTFLPVSKALLQSIVTRVGQPDTEVTVLGNVLPRAFMAVPPRDRAGSPFTFLTVGSLLPVKNQTLLLSAFAQVLRTRPDCRLVLVGDGPLRQSLEQQSAEAGLGDRVEFAGLLEPEQVRAQMQQADAFVFPSQFETFGVALIEALACGLPVIAMASGGPEEIVTPANGRLVAPADAAGLVAAMVEVASASGSFDAEAIQASARTTWGPQEFGQKLRAVYAKACGA
jgi:L-malate glycosyltransferase